MSESDTKSGSLCAEVLDELAAVLDGSAPARLADHVIDCDVCRDVRHDAAVAAGLIEGAGADFRAPSDFAERLIAKLEAARPDGGERRAPVVSSMEISAPAKASETVLSDTGLPALEAPSKTLEASPSDVEGLRQSNQDALRAESEQASIGRRGTYTPALRDEASVAGRESAAAHDDSKRALDDSQPRAIATPRPPREIAPADTGPVEPRSTEPRARTAAAAKPAMGRKVSTLRKPLFYAALVAAVSAAAGVGFLLRGRTPTNMALNDGAWSGKVTEVARASADKSGGLESCDATGACTALAAGGEVHAGAKLRTDARTRVHVAFADGTDLALDRSTTVELVAGGKRMARLVSGTLVAEVAHLEKGASAHIAFEHGDVEVIGTKLAMTAVGDRASVEVARGEVKVVTDAGKSVNVRAGEEATLLQGSEPEVASATSLADTLEWSDKTPEEVDAPVLRGLGELRARKPGSTTEKDHAVRLTKHAVRVRVVDVVARTEVDETFTNDTDDELEGIFRFPLPPGAQIEKLALEVDGKLVDGAFVDRDRGAAIWRGVIQNAAPKSPRPREEIIWVPGPWRDPALLEWQRGGRFELKIFPIPKRGSRRVVLTYTQVVDQASGVRRFTYPLALDTSGASSVDSFDVDLQVLGGDKAFGVQTRGYDLTAASADGGGERRVMHADHFVPAGDLTVEYALPDRNREVTAWAYRMDALPAPSAAPATPARGVKAKSADDKAAADAAAAIENDTSPYVAIAVRPKLPRWQEGKERLHVIVVDASRSMVGERFARATHLASSIVREMDRRDSFLLLTCDTVCRSMGGDPDHTVRPADPHAVASLAPGAAAAADVERYLATVEPDGGSDLAGSVSAARAAAGALGGRELRVIYLGDGTPTVGPTRPSHLEAAVRGALADRDGSVIAVALGADADTASLKALARGSGGIVVPYVPGQRVASAAVDVLGAAYGLALREPEVELPPGLTQVTPAHLDPIRSGGEAFIVARMSGGDRIDGALKLRGRVGSEAFEQSYPLKIVSSSSAGNAFVPRLYAAAKIAEMETLGGQTEKPMVVELSRRFSVASRFTSLLVLESEAMYTAFGVDRSASRSAFTGEDAAESSSADGDVAVDDSASTDGVASAHASPKPASNRFDDDPSAGRVGASASEGARSAPMPGGGSFGPSGAVDAPILAAPASPAPPAAAAATASPPRMEKEPSEPKDELDRRDSNGFDKSREIAPAKKVAGGMSSRQVSPDKNAFRGPEWRGGRRMIPMRKVFDRKASFDAANTLAQQNASKLIVAENGIEAARDSRDKTVELFALYATSGRIGEAQELTARWSGRDPLDPDALLARADLAARRGDRDRAIRVLGGLTDVRPGDRAPLVRLADLEDAAGSAALACEYRVALADLAPSEAKVVADAVRCARGQGMSDLASLLARDAGDTVRDQIEKLVAVPPVVAALRGDVQVSAEWSGGEDLDVALIDAQGHRISWLGSPTKATGMTSRDVTSTHTEGLGLTNLPSGSYIVEISRAAGGDDVRSPIRGDVTLKLVSETRKIPFVLTGSRAEVGTLRVFFTSRLVPIDVPATVGGWGGVF